MIIRNVGKNKFVVPAGSEAPSKKYPKGRKLIAHIQPGQHADIPDEIAEKLMRQFPDVFAEYIVPPPKVAKPKPQGEDQGPDGPTGDKPRQAPRPAPAPVQAAKPVPGPDPLPSESKS